MTPFLVAISGVLAHFFLASAWPIEVRALAALTICGLVPGALLVFRLVVQSDAPPEVLEFWLYATGAGYAITVIGMLLLSYLPGPLYAWQILFSADSFSLVLFALVWRQWRRANRDRCAENHSPAQLVQRNLRWLIVGGLFLLVLGGALRLGSLGYAEFLTDEARVVLRAAAVIQGYDDVLFIHRKGPAEILLPTTVFSLAGQMTEAAARLPFALASVTAIFALWLLGRRMFGEIAGWTAAFLLVFDGYLVGFAHFAQFQSIVVLSSILVLLVLQRLERSPQALTRYLTLAALLFAVGLLSHYDALLIVFPAFILLGALCWRERQRWRQIVASALPGVGLGVMVLALFYTPFVLDPHFQATYTYIAERRISGAGFPYNNLPDILRRSSVYNAVYYLAAMALLIFVALGISYRRGWHGKGWPTVSFVAPLVAAGVAWMALTRSSLFQVGNASLVVAPFMLLLAPVWLAPHLPSGWRMTWVWFGAATLIALCLVAFPRTHVYTIAPSAALLAGVAAAHGYDWLAARLGMQRAQVTGLATVALASLIFGVYVYRYFIYTDQEVLRTWPAEHLAFYWQPANLDTVDALYGFPLVNGWKTAGVLYAQGKLQGSFETNQRDDLITSWYTRGAERCFATAQNYFVIDTIEPWVERPEATSARIQSYGFAPWGVVTVGGNPSMSIYHLGAEASQHLPQEDFAPRFDQMATPDLPLDFPAVEPPMTTRHQANLDNQIVLEGFSIEQPEQLRAGDAIRLRLFWRARQPLDRSYKVFVQSYYGDGVMVAQQDGLPVCDRYLTAQWDPGELVVDSRTVPIADTAPPGDYPLYVGFYAEETGERLPLLNAAGVQIDDKIHLLDLQIAPPRR
ncbi:MAG TPA: hypothetical protein GX400_01660 [Chloroflexi bacterium]|nr:hypothetical protein [Chloroflexota bacterium]